MITTLIALSIIGLCFLIFWSRGSSSYFNIRRLKHKGLLKSKRPTMFDVRQLIIEGHKNEAIELYALLFKVNRKEARKNVDNIEKHIQEKHHI
jgi:hypothetical protein